MSLPIPTVGNESGPDYALDVNSALTIIDGHTHTPGSGLAITPAGLNINSALTFQNNPATGLQSSVYTAQSSLVTLQAVYVVGADLYYNDANGNVVRLTQGGSVAGSTGSISGLTSPASASYSAPTFVWQSNSLTPANMDAGSYIFRNVSASSKGITVSAPNSLASNYSIILPLLPSSQKIMTLDNAGNMTAPYTLDSTLSVTSNVIGVAGGAIVPSGSIIMYSGASAPSNYLLCDGTSYLQSDFPGLFAVIGTAYGSADGTHFNVPDFRGMFPRGVTGASGNDPDASSRTANNSGGNTGNNVGSQQSSEFASHVHSEQVFAAGSNGGPIPVGFTTVGALQAPNTNTAATGGNETRPINLYVNFIIKT